MNKKLFKSTVGKHVPATNTVNSEGAPAYGFSPKHNLAQFAATGCLNHTFYATDIDQLTTVLGLCKKVDSEFIAKVAVYARTKNFMKDMPALLTAILAAEHPELFKKVFPKVVDNGKMLRNFMQTIRSGVVGRKSFGSSSKKQIRKWFDRNTDENLVWASVGNDPSMADMIKMSHPKPSTKSREALYGYFLGKEVNVEALPELVRAYEVFKKDTTLPVPNVPFQMLTSLNLNTDTWTEIAKNAPWHMTRMNLNTFKRHGVLENPDMVKMIASRLKNPELIAKAKVFPYQLMTAYKFAQDMPFEITEALQDAMEIAINNVPAIEGKVYVCLDVSGSMSAPVTGYRAGSTSEVQCVDVAALVAAAVLRKNPRAEVIPFNQEVVTSLLHLNTRDSVMTNAQKLASAGGGTNISAPIKMLNDKNAKGDLVIFISDNESWVDADIPYRGTAMMEEWSEFQSRNPQAKLVCIDLTPNSSTQALDRNDILNVGGFSDEVFNVLAAFSAGNSASEHWVKEIESIDL